MPFENGCLMVADRTGHAVCIEMAAGCVEVRDVSGKAFGHANDVLFESLKKFENANAWATSPLRQKRIDELLRAKAGEISADYRQEIVKDHAAFPLSICRHYDKRDALTTSAAFVADLTNLRMHIAIGNPCTAPFETYVLPA